jgi:hypothetical protein
VIEAENARPAYFDQSGKGLRRTDEEPAAGTLQMDPVVADQPGEGKPPRTPGLHQFKRQPRFARS